MNKQKKKKRGKKSVQNLLGLQGFTTYGLKTTGGELVYFAIQPTNISVLSHVNIEIKIRHLLMVLTALPHLEVACLDSAQRFDDNQQFMESRIRQEATACCSGADSTTPTPPLRKARATLSPPCCGK